MQRFNINWTAKALVNQMEKRSLLLATDEAEEPDLEEVGLDEMDDSEQFEEEHAV